jgi:Ribbon-helix-helix protein, copG family
MAERERVSLELDSEVLRLLRARATETGVSESEILERAFCAADLQDLLEDIRSRSDLDEDAAMQLAREELSAARAEKATRAA